MNREIFDKEYFHDDYSRQFSEMRNRYHNRTQSALKRRSVDKAPMPNATTVVLMKDMPDGGVSITTGDFVSYFNQKYGCERVENVRRSLVQARRRSELKRVSATAKAETSARVVKKNTQKKANKLRLSFARVALCFMLLLSITMLLGTSLLLDNERQQVVSLQKEVELLQNETLHADVQATSEDFAHLESLSFSQENSVEIYTAEQEESAMSVLLNALASLGKE